MRRLLHTIIAFALLLLPLSARAEAGKYIFEHFPVSVNWINAVYQDRDGFLWVGCGNGLYRYTTGSTASYDLIYDGDACQSIVQAADGCLWVRNNSAYMVYDPVTRTLLPEEQAAAELGSQVWIAVLDIDEKDNFWWAEGSRMHCRIAKSGEDILLGTAESEVRDIFCRDNVAYILTVEGRLYRYTFDAEGRIASLPTLDPKAELADGSLDFRFHCVFVDSHRNIWLSQGARGVWFYSGSSSVPVHLVGSASPDTIPEGFINSIEEDADGNVWLATDHGGISVCDRDGKVVSRIAVSPDNSGGLLSSGVYDLYRDPQDNMWVAYSKQGLSVWRGRNKAWSLSHIAGLQENNLPDDINTICQDKSGNLWLGTDGSGLYMIDARTGRETAFTAGNSSLGSNVVTDLFCDSRGRVWIGTFLGGMSCLDGHSLRSWDYVPDGSSLASENVWAFCEDLSGTIWIGTLGGGLQSYDPATGRFETYNTRNSALANDYVLQLEAARDGNIYIATSYGLSVMNPMTRTMKTLPFSDEMIYKGMAGLTVDDSGMVWLDEDGRLQMYDPESGRYYTPGHPSLTAVRSVLTDAAGAVWAVTDNALCKVVPEKLSDGGYAFNVSAFSFPQISGLHFNQRSACLLADGDFAIGSFSGYMRFSPGRFTAVQVPEAKLHFTELYLDNTPIRPGVEYGGRVILPKALEYTEAVELSHRQSQISIGFTCMDWFSVQKPDLYYRLEGLSDEWIALDRSTRSLTFANIAPGRYALCLTSNPDSPQAGIRLGIQVKPPFWANPLAYVFYLLLLAAGVMYLRYRASRWRELQERALMQERQHYIDEMKMQFFTNVSHDFRTPLTLILTPLEEHLRSNPEAKEDKLYATIYRNARRLQNLVNEVLDLRRLELYGSELNLASGNFVRSVRDVLAQFELMASGQGITLSLHAAKESLIFDYDSNKMEKVLTNLLSNAFKFTPAGGSVSVDISDGEDGRVSVKVADTGCGIPDSEKRRVFERFYQAGGSQPGSGIGLHVVREFVELHGGEIFVKDNEPQGSVFMFTIPARHSAAASRQTGNNEEIKVEAASNAGAESSPVPAAEPSSPENARPTVLLVDDNADFREFLATALSDEYRTLTAGDGSAALKTVEDNDVDVVICDVMMPVMDGNEFCRRMKSSLNTSHIPVILLTAKALQEDEFAGLEAGADDYLTKPFNLSILRLKIARFIQWKQRTKRLFEKELEITTEQMTLTPMDDRLLQSAINVINENISNPDFSVEDLSSALHMHRTSLYKKLVYITGKTPMEFIRALRLKRAAVLLQTGGVYVSEVAYMVGFNSPKIFAGHFKDEFGCSPTEYRKKMAETTKNQE